MNFDAAAVAARDPESFERFLKQRDEIASAYVNADAEPLAAIVTRSDPATFMSPGGDVVSGASAIAERYASDARTFAKGSTSHLEVLQSGSGSLAFWTGIQYAQVKLAGKDARVPMALRVTEVFRFEDGAWKLIHRHAEMGKSGPS